MEAWIPSQTPYLVDPSPAQIVLASWQLPGLRCPDVSFVTMSLFISLPLRFLLSPNRSSGKILSSLEHPLSLSERDWLRVFLWTIDFVGSCFLNGRGTTGRWRCCCCFHAIVACSATRRATLVFRLPERWFLRVLFVFSFPLCLAENVIGATFQHRTRQWSACARLSAWDKLSSLHAKTSQLLSLAQAMYWCCKHQNTSFC